MTTKEEVLRLAEESGFDTDDGCVYLRYNHDSYANVTQQITKLIELAKAQGADEEREACLKICEDFNQLAVESRTRLSSAFECAEAIRNRKDNHEQ